jgi:hypothetical protein
MKRLILLLLITFTSQISFSQDRSSAIIKRISKDWKHDSLTKDGYRMAVFKALRASLPDSLSPGDLLKYLGKPFQIQMFGSGNTHKSYVQYIYFYWDSYTIPNECCFERLYIAFVFDETDTHLLYIDDGMYCG